MRHSIITWSLVIAANWIAVVSTDRADAQGFQNLDQLDSLVATTVGAGIGEPGGPLAPVDRRLRLAACPGIPSIEGPVFGAAIVRCDKLGWRIRVPLKIDRAPQQAAYGHPQPVAAPQQRIVLIKKGDPVQLVAGNASFSVSKSMIADEDGAVGEMIRVREDRMSPAVAGRVEADGLIRVPGI